MWHLGNDLKKKKWGAVARHKKFTHDYLWNKSYRKTRDSFIMQNLLKGIFLNNLDKTINVILLSRKLR